MLVNLKSEIKLFWHRINNYGDYLSYELLKKISKYKVVFSDAIDADIIAIGSIFAIIPRDYKGFIWGTGSIDGNKKVFPNAKIKAVRGKLTRKVLELGEQTIIGDPALLIPNYFKTSMKKKYKLGIILHYIEKRDKVVNYLNTKYSDIHLIDIQDSIDKVILEVSECEYLLSSSLHGIVTGDALGIKTWWLKCSDKIIGKGFKFRDYYSAFGIENIKEINLSENDDMDKILSAIEAKKGSIDIIQKMKYKIQKELQQSFPF